VDEVFGTHSDIAQVRIGEECPDQSGTFLEPPQGAGLDFSPGDGFLSLISVPAF